MPGGWAPGCVNRGPRSRRADLTTFTRLATSRTSDERPSQEPERARTRVDAAERATEARSTSGERLTRDQERQPADLAPKYQCDHPGDSGDAPPGGDPVALAVGAAALEALR